MINNSQLCKERYKARYVFVQQKVLSDELPDASYKGCWVTHMDRQRYWGAVCDERVSRGQTNERDEYHRLAREYLARQPSIEEDILEALRANVDPFYAILMVGARQVQLNTG